MGDRVAVMRKGELQQVADPQTLYDRPVNLFVGGFIGSPAMNMVEATDRARRTAASRSSRRPEARARRGVRPPSRPALGVVRGPAGDPRASGPSTSRRSRSRPTRRPAGGCAGTVELREALGSELMVHFTRRGRAAGRDGGDEGARERRRNGSRRPSRPRTRSSSAASGRARTSSEGEPVEVVGRHELAAFLRPGDGSRDLRPGAGERSSIVTRRWARERRRLPGGRPARRARRIEQRLRSDEGARSAVSGSITFDGVWTGAEAKAFGDVIKAFNKVIPGREGQLQAGRRQPADGASRPRSRAATRPTWPTSPSPASSSSSSTRAR